MIFLNIIRSAEDDFSLNLVFDLSWSKNKISLSNNSIASITVLIVKILPRNAPLRIIHCFLQSNLGRHLTPLVQFGKFV